jgi:hypothetical protein
MCGTESTIVNMQATKYSSAAASHMQALITLTYRMNISVQLSKQRLH